MTNACLKQTSLLHAPCGCVLIHALPLAPPLPQGTLTWTNTGSLGGGGATKLTARMKLDKDSMQQMPTLTLTKDWDVDF